MLQMDIGLPRQDPEPPEAISSPFAVWVRDVLEVAFDQVRRHSGQRYKSLYNQRAVRRLFAIGDWVMHFYPAVKKCLGRSVASGVYRRGLPSIDVLPPDEGVVLADVDSVGGGRSA